MIINFRFIYFRCIHKIYYKLKIKEHKVGSRLGTLMLAVRLDVCMVCIFK